MDVKINENIILQALDWSYDKAVNGVRGLDSAIDLGNEFLGGEGTMLDKTNRLIRWQVSKAATSGFISGLGGLAFIPVTIPANITSVIYVQIRMIAAIAYMGGHDIKSDKVKTLIFACLAGNGIKDILKDADMIVGMKLAKGTIQNISGKTITVINQKVGFRLITKFGEKGAVNLGKMVRFLGGVIGGTIDGVVTNTIGNVARNTFIEGRISE